MVAICQPVGQMRFGVRNFLKGTHAPEYYSARGEDCPPRYDETREQFLSNGEEYSYIFTSAGWVCYDMNEFNDNEPEN